VTPSAEIPAATGRFSYPWRRRVMTTVTDVGRLSSRRDWIELHLSSASDLDRLGELLAAALAADA
jgi:hypothetical protein